MPSQAAATIASLRADLREAQEHHSNELLEMEAQYFQQMQLLQQEHAAMLGELFDRQQQIRRHSGFSPTKHYGGVASPIRTIRSQQAEQEELAGLKRELQKVYAEKDAEVGEVRVAMRAALHAKEEEYHRLLMVGSHKPLHFPLKLRPNQNVPTAYEQCLSHYNGTE